MPNTLPVVFRSAPLPINFQGTPQQFLDAIVARLAIDAQTSISFFVSGSVAPTSDQGPWLKNGVTWYVWDTITGAYIPEEIEAQSLQYIAQQTAPDQNKFTFWIKLDASGKAQSIQYYWSGAWHDFYEDTFALYYTKTQIDAFFASETAGKKNVDWGNVVNRPVYGTAAFKAQNNSAQSFVFGGAGTQTGQITYGSEIYDPDTVFDSNQFVAPSDGIYTFNCFTYISVTAGTPTNNIISVSLKVNGSATDSALPTAPPTSGGIMNFTTDVKLAAGDVVTTEISIQVNGGSGTWTIAASYTTLSGHRVQ